MNITWHGGPWKFHKCGLVLPDSVHSVWWIGPFMVYIQRGDRYLEGLPR